MTETITGLFQKYDDAVAAVRRLEAEGIAHADISLVSNNSDQLQHTNIAAATAEDAGVGAGLGATVGAAGGLLAGLGMIALPGIGPVIAAGWLISTVAGVAAGSVVGGTAGAIAGALMRTGSTEGDAEAYVEAIRQGGTIVSVRATSEQIAVTRSIFQRMGAADPNELTGPQNEFDASLPKNAPEEVRKVREQLADRSMNG